MVDASATPQTLVADPDAYRPLLADHARRPAVVVIVLSILVVAVLGMRYANHGTAGQLDLTLDAFIRTRIRRDQPLTRALVSLGDPLQATILVAVVAAAAAAARRWSGVVLCIGGTLTAVTITDVILKPLVGRLRFGHLSFPSGHTTAVASVAIAIAILLTSTQRPRSIALHLIAGTAVATAAGVAVALIAQSIHYTTDTVAGFCVALATVLTAALVLDVVAPRVRSRPPPPPAPVLTAGSATSEARSTLLGRALIPGLAPGGTRGPRSGPGRRRHRDQVGPHGNRLVGSDPARRTGTPSEALIHRVGEHTPWSPWSPRNRASTPPGMITRWPPWARDRDHGLGLES